MNKTLENITKTLQKHKKTLENIRSSRPSAHDPRRQCRLGCGFIQSGGIQTHGRTRGGGLLPPGAPPQNTLPLTSQRERAALGVHWCSYLSSLFFCFLMFSDICSDVSHVFLCSLMCSCVLSCFFLCSLMCSCVFFRFLVFSDVFLCPLMYYCVFLCFLVVSCVFLCFLMVSYVI